MVRTVYELITLAIFSGCRAPTIVSSGSEESKHLDLVKVLQTYACREMWRFRSGAAVSGLYHESHNRLLVDQLQE